MLEGLSKKFWDAVHVSRAEPREGSRDARHQNTVLIAIRTTFSGKTADDLTAQRQRLERLATAQVLVERAVRAHQGLVPGMGAKMLLNPLHLKKLG